MIFVVNGTCFFRVENQTSVLQSISTHKFSTVIDQRQAMFNLSAFLGLTHSNPKDSIVMFLVFSGSEGSIEFTKPVRSQLFIVSFDSFNLRLFFCPSRRNQRLFILTNLFSIANDSSEYKIYDGLVHL